MKRYCRPLAVSVSIAVLVALVSMLAGWSIFTKLSRRFAEEL